MLPLWAVANDCARYLHPLSAFVAVSQILRNYSHFSRFEMKRSRAAERAVRDHLREEVADLRGYRNIRQAEALINGADAGMESPGEGYLLWITYCILHNVGTGNVEVRTQYPVQAAGNLYYAGIALPEYRVLLEFDGATKVLAGGAAFLERQRNLQLAGWTVIRVDLRQLEDPGALVEYLVRELRKAGVPGGRPRGPLWKPIPSSLLDAARRF